MADRLGTARSVALRARCILPRRSQEGLGMKRTLAALAFAVCTATAVLSQTTITSCGAIVPPRGSGYVANDITCSPSDPFVIRVDDRGKLDLAGHTLDHGDRGVKCTGKCVLSST